MRKNMREFAAGDAETLAQWNPDALVAPIVQVRSLTEAKKTGAVESLAFSTAIVALTKMGEEMVSEEDRDTVWNIFGVPVFEQRHGHDGRVVARECEVHDGLHITGGAAAEMLAGEELVTDECECGSSSPRLRRVGPIDPAEASAAD